MATPTALCGKRHGTVKPPSVTHYSRSVGGRHRRLPAGTGARRALAVRQALAFNVAPEDVAVHDHVLRVEVGTMGADRVGDQGGAADRSQMHILPTDLPRLTPHPPAHASRPRV